jgi:hypothetical protein
MAKALFSEMFCKGEINIVTDHDIEVTGQIEEKVKDNIVHFIAAAPPDHRASFTGSGLPFANQLQAFYNTPNQGVVTLNEQNMFKINLIIPNSYMIGLGSVTVPPTLYLQYFTDNSNEERMINIKLSYGIPYRSMTYPMFPRPRQNVTFYDSQFYLPVRSQEQILKEAAYPTINYMPDNHWGTKPPM